MVFVPIICGSGQPLIAGICHQVRTQGQSQNDSEATWHSCSDSILIRCVQAQPAVAANQARAASAAVPLPFSSSFVYAAPLDISRASIGDLMAVGVPGQEKIDEEQSLFCRASQKHSLRAFCVLGPKPS